jgi:hypothetical protein
MPRRHNWRLVLPPTPGRKRKDDSILLGVPELIAECLNGQWRISLSPIVDQHIGAAAWADGLLHQAHHLSRGTINEVRVRGNTTIFTAWPLRPLRIPPTIRLPARPRCPSRFVLTVASRHNALSLTTLANFTIQHVGDCGHYGSARTEGRGSLLWIRAPRGRAILIP